MIGWVNLIEYIIIMNLGVWVSLTRKSETTILDHLQLRGESWNFDILVQIPFPTHVFERENLGHAIS